MRQILLAVLLAAVSLGEETEVAPEAVPEGPPGVEAVIAERALLPPPSPPAVPEGVVMAISSTDERSAQAVRNGMLCLHTGWDFEAYRHFCMALREDPNCLMAHWGVGLALLHGSQDMQQERGAALERMLALVDQGVGTDLEKRYVFGLTKLMTEGPAQAAEAFIGAAREFPGDPQLTLLKCLLSRGGYDLEGQPNPDQVRAEEEMKEVIEKHPERTWLRYAYLAMRAEAASLEGGLEMARQLAADAPEYPPYFHLLGHYEWRCGNHTRAANAFGHAADLYSGWMRANGVKTADCPSWTKAESYRAVALASKGEYETALAIADGVAAIEIPMDRANSNGGRMLMWEGKTLPVRILMRRGKPGDMVRATKVLPPLEEVKELGKKTLSLWSFQVHSSLAAGRLALERSEMIAAREISRDVTNIGENYVKTRSVAEVNGERSHWLRGFRSFEVMVSEFRGLLTMKLPKGERGGAFNWFRSAADRQVRASLMMPPSVLLPMECRLAEFYADQKEDDKAIEVLLEGLESFPNDIEILNRLVAAHERSGNPEEAEEVRHRIETLGEE